MPSSTRPRAKKAVAVAAAVAEPAVTPPVVAKPGVATAGVAKRAVAEAVATPVAAKRPAAKPVAAEAITQPADAKPVGGRVEGAKPAAAKGVARRAAARPAVANNAVAPQAMADATLAKLAAAKAAIARAAGAEAAIEPGFAEPSFAESMLAESIGSQPSFAEPKGAQPKDAQPSFAEALLAERLDEEAAAPTPVAAKAPSAPRRLLAGLDRLPPIKLPIGPAIPWRFGLPALLALVIGMAVLNHQPAAHAETTQRSFHLPADETYPVTENSPLFPNSQAAQAQPIGVTDPPGLGVDMVDLTLKLVAVLALAYGSLTVLRRVGIGGGGRLAQSGGGQGVDGLRVLSSMSLAPNRTVHIVRAPGGKTLLLGSTPGQVNLLADLGQVSEADLAGAGSTSFLDVLASKLQR